MFKIISARIPLRSSSRFYTWTFTFLIYINDLSDNLTSNPKLFYDNTLFSTVTDPNVTANQTNNALDHIITWANQWEMNFNPDTSKQAQEVIFSRKVKVTAHAHIFSTIIQYVKPQLKSIL